MLIHCDDSHTGRVVEYIGADKVKCFYLYIDLLECGTQGDGVGLWVSEESGQIRAVMYRYFDTLHLYSRGACPREEVLSLIRELAPKVITGDVDNIKRLLTGLDASRYAYEESWIITADKLMDGRSELSVYEAGEADVPEIAALMMKADIYSAVYTYDGLCVELYRRLREGFGHLYAMRDETGRLAATNATNAETADMAVISGLVTDPDMRGRGLGRAITASTWNLVKLAGKTGIAFLGADNENTLRLHRAMGYTFHGLYARLIRE